MMVKQSNQPAKTKKTVPVLDFELEGNRNTLPPDYFVLLFPINSLMALVLTLLMVSAIDPEEYSLIPGMKDNKYAQEGWIAGFLFAFLLFVNLVMTIQVIKLCEKHRLSSTTTSKWIGQTLISGVMSWKVLKEADNVMYEEDKELLASSLGIDNCLVGPFFLTCNRRNLNRTCRHAVKQTVLQKVKKPARSAPSNIKSKPKAKRNVKNAKSTPNVRQNFRQSINPKTRSLKIFPQENNFNLHANRKSGPVFRQRKNDTPSTESSFPSESDSDDED